MQQVTATAVMQSCGDISYVPATGLAKTTIEAVAVLVK
jgi:hypothetical protein